MQTRKYIRLLLPNGTGTAPVNPASQRGFTLVEMIVVIVITGIIGGMVAMFIRAPVQGYVDSARRAEMTDIADTALRRISRDIRLALPNSMRVTGICDGTAAATCYIEFLPTSGGGRYRSGAGGVLGAELDFTQPDSSFEVIGTPPVMAAGDSIVVYNLTSDAADPNPNAYVGANRVAASIAGNIVTFAAPRQFPLDSCQRNPATGDVVGGCRFQVIGTPVTYACNPAAGTLTRWQGYAIQPAQPTVLPAGGTAALLANNVSGCIFTYNVSATAERSGLVTMHLTITQQGESVSLYSATHVSNVP
jgi:MSHA biogenesis protein MshO